MSPGSPDSEETPRPPATPEFGYVQAGGPAHVYPVSPGGLAVKKLSTGPYDNNVYVMSAGGEAFLIDGAAEPDRILRELEGVRVLAILQTHNHSDHVQALGKLVAELGVPVHAHSDDPVPVEFDPLADGETLRVGGVSVSVIHNPGHTPGSLSFVADGFLFSGDTLFPGGPGNTFGDRTSFEQIMGSLQRLFALPDETRVLPGHGIDTRIGLERPHLATWHRRGW